MLQPLVPSAIGDQRRPLPKRDELPWPPLDRLVKGSMRDGVISDKRDQFLDVAIPVVPKLDAVGQIESWAFALMQGDP